VNRILYRYKANDTRLAATPKPEMKTMKATYYVQYPADYDIYETAEEFLFDLQEDYPEMQSVSIIELGTEIVKDNRRYTAILEVPQELVERDAALEVEEEIEEEVEEEEEEIDEDEDEEYDEIEEIEEETEEIEEEIDKQSYFIGNEFVSQYSLLPSLVFHDLVSPNNRAKLENEMESLTMIP
jgi:vacuolar-type H+-ATPase subunit I/STV1